MTAPISAGPFALTSVGNASAGTTVYTGTISGGTLSGANNALAGFKFRVTGFTLTNGCNNGTFMCVASGTGSLTLGNPNGVAETGVGAASGWIENADGPYLGPEGVAGTTTQPTPILVPNAPKGDSLVPNNFNSGFNYTNSELSTQKYASSLVQAQLNGVAFNYQTPVTPGVGPTGPCVGNKIDVQTTPLPPVGS